MEDWPQNWLISVSNESLNNPPAPGSSRGGAGSGGLASELANVSKYRMNCVFKSSLEPVTLHHYSLYKELINYMYKGQSINTRKSAAISTPFDQKLLNCNT